MITQTQINEIGRIHKIHPRYRTELLKLANGQLDNDQFGERLHNYRNYQTACADMMHVMAKPIHHYWKAKARNGQNALAIR